MMTATYSPEDNKLRLYSLARLSAEDFARIKSHGFQWAPKQELFVAPAWTPAREDVLLDLCGEIGDEDYSPEERAADRAERFGAYRDKRAAEATGRADSFDAGPAAFGHQSAARAERQATRHDRHRTAAVSQWAKAEYWQARTAGVIRSALYKSSPAVRRGRILTIEAEERKQRKALDEYAARFAAWEKVYTLDGCDRPGRHVETRDEAGNLRGMGFDPGSVTPALKVAHALANYGSHGEYAHPRTGRKSSLYSLLTDAADPITPAEAAALWLDRKPNPADPNSYGRRWAAHYANRLAYERAMIAAEGGSVDAVTMEPGGWIKASRRTGSVFTDVAGGWMQVHAVTKSPATGRVTSVKVMGTRGYSDPKPGLVSVNVQRLPESAYRAPTDEERAAFAAQVKEAKKAAKATAPKSPPLVNPTDEDAAKLQALWNERAEAAHRKAGNHGAFAPSAVWPMTQAEYSARSKGDYGPCGTADVSERGEVREYGRGGRVTVFKVRKGSGGGFSMYAAPRVVVLTDKPRKPLPWAEMEAVRATMPTPATVFPRLGDLAAVLADYWNAGQTEEGKRLLADAAYIGWAWASSASQRGFTDEGAAAFKRFQESQAVPA